MQIQEISELKDEHRALKKERVGEDFLLEERLEIGRQIAGIVEQITELLIKKMALAGMARNYLS